MRKTTKIQSRPDDPSPADWGRLYDAADAFRQLAPWEWTDDDRAFGVQCPETGETYYCVVLGALREVFALAAYEGAEGLDGYLKCLSGEAGENALAPEYQRALMASFENRTDIEHRDRTVIEILGRKYQGPKAWPLFRHFLPGYLPWFLSAVQARTLAACLEQAVSVLPRLARDPGLLPDPAAGLFLVRVPQTDAAGNLKWHDEMLPAPRPPHKAQPQIPVDEVGIERLRHQSKRRAGDWEIGYAYTPMPIQENPDQRPYLLRLLGVADAESGYVFTVHLEMPDRCLPVFRDKLLSCLGEAPHWPERLLVNHDDAAALAAPIAKALGIPLKRVEELPAFETAYESLIEAMKTRKKR